MTKFKAGDTVIANQSSSVNRITKGRKYLVLYARWQYIKIEGDDGKIREVFNCRFELVPPADALPPADELPPAPESVMYFNSVRELRNTQNLYVRKHFNLPGSISIGVAKSGYHGNTGGVGYPDVLAINLDPDSALQLASDIRRIAMSIKRNQKQES